MKFIKKDAFTLAEILITIGIIGVVAALTIPLLIQNSNSKKFVTQYKKSLSTLDQAAIGAQAQYDMDYSTLTLVSDDTTCKSDTLSGGKFSLCGLFNNTLSAQTYLGKYGNVKGPNLETPYQVTISSLTPNNFLFFSFADGAFVAFNPNAKECGIGVGNTISTEMLTGKLANCLGFIDVNGPNPPNREVICAEDTTELSVSSTCKVTNASMGDIFPIVFHDGNVEPATNASLAAFLGGNGKEVHTEKPKTAAQLAADKVTSQKHKDILNSLDSYKEQALNQYKQAGYETLDTAAYRRGSGNTAVYKVTTDKNGNTTMEYVKMNDFQIFHDGNFDNNSFNYYIFVNGDTATSNIRLKEENGEVKAYSSKFHLYVNQWHNDTVESHGFDI